MTWLAPCLMVQGTASSAGKSLLVAALCRILRRDGCRVAPFKAQNMALNSFVTPDGDEIGRAQAVQAESAGIPPHVDMNPILLKPEADARCQVVVRGKPAAVLSAGDYYRLKDELWPIVTRALEALRARFDAVVIEGAGSPAEVNLRDGDIVNMRVAREAGAPVLLVGDIDRGGVFAALVGTLELLDVEERRLVKGLVINKFRGDVALLLPGLQFLEQRTGKPVLGVIPHIPDLRIADEDSLGLEARRHGRAQADAQALDVAVIRLPHLANFDDFDPLEADAVVAVRFVGNARELGEPDLVILPGTKATRSDLAWLDCTGLAGAVSALARAGTPIIGICGGFQMLGARIEDREGVEGPAGVVKGLGLLPLATEFVAEKATAQVKASVLADAGMLAGLRGAPLAGYEIHMGRARPIDGEAPPIPFCRITEGSREADHDGVLAGAGWILGTYLHGLFDNDELRRGILVNVARRSGRRLPSQPAVVSRDREYDRLADVVLQHLDVDQIYGWLGVGRRRE